MSKLRIMVVAASIFFGSALSITADAPPPTCCSQATSGQPSLWVIMKILLRLA